MNKFFLFAALFSAAGFSAQAQFTLNAGDNTLEINGRVAAYYNYRFLKPTETSYKKNTFVLRNLQINLEGQKGNKLEYRIQVDFATLATNSSAGGLADPENPGLMHAYVAYTALPVKIKFGYSKLPYSQGSLNDVYDSPYWSRGVLTSGTLFTRRDIGLTLSSSLLKQRLNIYGGVYTGLGENVIAVGDNDPSGNLEFVGRVDMAWPSRYRYNEIDAVGVPVPVLRVGVNARYANKTQPIGSTLPTALLDDYHLRFIDGKRTMYGADATFAFRHLSAQAEYHRIVATPSQPGNILLVNTPADVNGGQVNAGGYLLQLNYDWLKAKSIFSARYENINLNDLVYGSEEWLNFGYAYTLDGFRSIVKLQYYRPLTEDPKSNPLKYTDQLRLGWQHSF